MRLYFCTGNKNKFETMKNILTQEGIELVRKEILFNEARSLDVVEIVKNKIEQAAKLLPGECFIVEDSAFVVPSLNGFPGPYVHFVLETIGLEGLLKLLNEKKRDCYFESALAYVDPKTGSKIFGYKSFGVVSKKIALKNRINAWSELWQIFIPSGYDKTLAELTDEEFQQRETQLNKNSSINKFIEWYKQKKNY